MDIRARRAFRALAAGALVMAAFAIAMTSTPASARGLAACGDKKYTAPNTNCLVPSGATSVLVEAAGAAGGKGGASSNQGGAAGAGTIESGIFTVHPGEQLELTAGTPGTAGKADPGTPGKGGKPYGGAGGAGTGPNANLGGGGGGGGLSEVVDADNGETLIIGGGGGGGGGAGNDQQGNSNDNGGAGGSNGGNGGNGEGTGGVGGASVDGAQGEPGGGGNTNEAGGGGGGAGCPGGTGGSSGSTSDSNGSGGGGGAGTSCGGSNDLGSNRAKGYVTLLFDPVIKSFNPAKGKAGTTVTIMGQNLAKATVAFNGVGASIVKDTASEVMAKVPAGATTGRITVSTAAGTATSKKKFTVT
jgi:IPT/TIG domain